MKKMSAHHKLAIASLSLFLTGTPLLHAEETRTVLQTGEKKPVVIETSTASLKGTVVSIDYDSRTVTLRDSKGHVIAMVAGPEVTRFKEIKKKDVVKVDYLESTAILVQSADAAISSAEGSQSVIVRNQSKKPSGEKTDVDVLTAKVVSIDVNKRIIVVKGPEGQQKDIKIAPDVTNLGNIRKGDNVVVRMTRTIAIDVTKP
ncbi:MAG: hypothetical protein WCG19_02105 [Chlorobiaceae bacterium]